jgi:hypothetical protein
MSKLPYGDVVIVGTRFLEDMDAEVPVATVKWLKTFIGVKNEEGYPAKVKNDYGFLFTQEVWHAGMEDEIAKEWVSKNQNKTEAKVLKAVRQAIKLVQVKFPKVPVVVTRREGPLDSHESAAFFKEGTPPEDYSAFRDAFVELVRKELAEIK